MRLILTKEVSEQLKEIVLATNRETGACLFGSKDGDEFKVLHIAGPGKNAKLKMFHYEADHKHSEDVYNELLKVDPSLLHLGEFHVHPEGMSEFSSVDLRTIKKVLKTYQEFVAGVMLREDGEVKFFPVYFSKEKPEGVPIELVIE